MSQFNLKSVIVGVETTKGVAPAAASFYKLPINGEIGLSVQSNSGSNNVLSDSRLANEEYETTKTVSGSIPISSDYKNVYFPLALGMGKPAVVTDNTDGTFTRIFTPLNCQETVTVQRRLSPLCAGDPDFVETFKGVGIDGWSINIQDEKLQVPMTAKGGVVTDSNDTGFTAIDDTVAKQLTDSDIRKSHAVLKKGGVEYKLSNQLSIQIGNALSEQWYIGDGEFPSGLDLGAFTMNGSIAGVFDAAFLKTAKDSARSDFEVVFTHPVNPLVKLTFTLTNVFLKYKTEPFKVGEKATLSFDWVADIHSTVSATLTNEVATY